MIDRYTKVLLTVIAVNMTIMVGWGAAKVFVPEVRAYTADTFALITNQGYMEAIPVVCMKGCSDSEY